MEQPPPAPSDATHTSRTASPALVDRQVTLEGHEFSAATGQGTPLLLQSPGIEPANYRAPTLPIPPHSPLNESDPAHVQATATDHTSGATSAVGSAAAARRERRRPPSILHPDTVRRSRDQAAPTGQQRANTTAADGRPSSTAPSEKAVQSQQVAAASQPARGPLSGTEAASKGGVDNEQGPAADEVDPAARAPDEAAAEARSERELQQQDDEEAAEGPAVEERIRNPGLRVSTLFLITLAISSCVLVVLWSMIAGSYSDARDRVESISTSNHLALAASQWSAVVAGLQARTAVSELIFTSLNISSTLQLACSLGSTELQSIVVMPVAVMRPDTMPQICADPRTTTSAAGGIRGFFPPGTPEFETALRIQLEFDANWDRGTDHLGDVALRFGSNLVGECGQCTGNLGAEELLDVNGTLGDWVLHREARMRDALAEAYPLVKWNATTHEEAVQSVVEAALVDKTLFSIRYLADGPGDTLVFAQLSGFSVEMHSVRRESVFQQLFGHATDDHPNDVAQPFRFSQTTILVENRLPTLRAAHFQRQSRQIVEGAPMPYVRPFVTGSLRVIASTALAPERTPDDAEGAPLVAEFMERCARSTMPTPYSHLLPFPFAMQLDGDGRLQSKLRRRLPSANLVTGSVNLDLSIGRGDLLNWDVVLCGRPCEITSSVAVLEAYRQLLHNYSAGTGLFDNTTYGTAMDGKSFLKTMVDAARPHNAPLPAQCPDLAGQRVYVVSGSTDSSTTTQRTFDVVTAVAWLTVIGNLLLHIFLYGVVAVPVRYLRSRVINTLKGEETSLTLIHVIIIRVTRRLWVGELKSLTNAYSAMVLKYEQNKRFIPDYVRRRQENMNVNVLLAEAERMEAQQLRGRYSGGQGQRQAQADERGDQEALMAAMTALDGQQGGSANDGRRLASGKGPAPTALPADQDRNAALALGPAAVDVMDESRREDGIRTPLVAGDRRAGSAQPGGRGADGTADGTLRFEESGAGPGLSLTQPPSSIGGGAAVESAASGSPAGAHRVVHVTRANSVEPPSPFVPGNAVGFADAATSGASRQPRRMGVQHSRNNPMTYVERCSILVVSLTFLDGVYLENFMAAQTLHTKIIATILQATRKYRGEAFNKETLLFGASWNAFEPSVDHVHMAVACAVEVSNALAMLRSRVKIGLAVHTGPVVCGLVGDAVTVAHAIVGPTITTTLHLAELCRELRGVSVLVTQPVRQVVSIFYEVLLVDVVSTEEEKRRGMPPTSVFDVRPSASSLLSLHGEQRGSLTAAQLERNTFTVAYNNAFSQFRAHNFTGAIDTLLNVLNAEAERLRTRGFNGAAPESAGIDTLAASTSAFPLFRNDPALVRLMQLAQYYRRNPGQLPKPYVRAVPAWTLYEEAAALDGSPSTLRSEASPQPSSGGAVVAVHGGAGGGAAGTDDPGVLSTTIGALDGSEMQRLASTSVVFSSASPNGGPMATQGRTPSAIFGVTSQDSFRTHLAQAIHRKRGHKRTDSGRSNASTINNATNNGATGNGSAALGLPPVAASPTPSTDPSVCAIKGGRGASPRPYKAASRESFLGGVQPPTALSSSDTGTGRNTAPSAEPGGVHHRLSSGSDSQASPQAPTPASGSDAVQLPASAVLGTAEQVTSPEGSRPQDGTGDGETPLDSASVRPTSVRSAAGARESSPSFSGRESGPTRGAQRATNTTGGERLGETIEFASTSYQGHSQAMVESLLRWKPRPATVGDKRSNTLTQSARIRSGKAEGNPFQPAFGGLRTKSSPAAVPFVPTSQAVAPAQEEPRPAAVVVAPVQEFALITEASLTDAHGGGFDSLIDHRAQGPLGESHDQHGNSLRPDDDEDTSTEPTNPRRRTPPSKIVASNGCTYQRSERIIGRGSFGTVYLGMETHTGMLVALKVLPLPRSDAAEALENEVTIMQRVRDVHVVEFYGYAIEHGLIVIVMECVIAGSLQTMLGSFSTLSTMTTVNFMRDILRGLSRLHAEGIMHRDVKPQNVLVTTNGECKITDFGASAMLNALARGDGGDAPVEGTPLYLAPEAARGHATFKSDVWSVGVMFLQLTTGRVPYDLPPAEDIDVYAFVWQVGSGQLRPIHDRSRFNEQTNEFIDGCLDPDEDRRKTTSDLLSLPFFFL